MVSITLSIPEEVKKKMEGFSEINWSGFVRKCIESKVEKLTWKEQMLSKLEEEEESGFTDWTIEMGNKIKKGAWEKLKKQGW